MKNKNVFHVKTKNYYKKIKEFVQMNVQKIIIKTIILVLNVMTIVKLAQIKRKMKMKIVYLVKKIQLINI